MILIQSLSEEYFSSGTDYKYLRKTMENQKTDKIKTYFSQSDYFTKFICSYPKPVINHLNGVVLNSALSSLGQLPFTYASPDCIFQINCIDYNDLPHSGLSYFMNQLPKNLGTFMALTGLPLESSDLQFFNLIKGISDFDQDQIERFKQIANGEIYWQIYQDSYQDKNRIHLSRRRDQENSISQFLKRIKYENPKEVLLDLYYKQKIVEHANDTKQLSKETSYRLEDDQERHLRVLDNKHMMFEKILDENIQCYGQLPQTILQENINLINKAFGYNNVEQIKESLMEANTEYSLFLCSVLESKNQSILQLTVNLLRDAQNSNLVDSMKVEKNYRNQLLRNSQYKEIAYSQNQSDLSFEITREQVQNKSHQLIPIKRYYREFPEAFLCYFNGVQISDPEINRNYKKVVQDTLFRMGIDYFNPTYDKIRAGNLINQFFLKYHKIRHRHQNLEILLGEKFEIEKIKKEKIKFLSQKNNEKLQLKISQVQQEVEDSFNQEIRTERISSMRKMREFQMNQNANIIQNNLVKSYFCEYSPFAYDFKHDFPVEIEHNRNTLSKYTKNSIGFQDLKKNLNISQKINKQQIFNYVKGYPCFVTVNQDNTKVSIDLNHLSPEEIKYHLSEEILYQVKKFGIPEIVEKYQQDILKNLMKIYEEEIEKLEKSQREELLLKFHQKLFTQIQNKEFIDTCISQIQIKDQSFFDIKSQKNFNLQINEKVINLDEDIENFKNITFADQYSQQMITLSSSKSIMNYLIESQNVPPSYRRYFKLLEELSDQCDLFKEFIKMIEKEFNKIDFQKVQPENSSLQNLDQNLQDLKNKDIYLPQLLLRPLQYLLNGYENILQQIAIKGIKNVFKTKNIIPKLDSLIFISIDILGQTVDQLKEKSLMQEELKMIDIQKKMIKYPLKDFLLLEIIQKKLKKVNEYEKNRQYRSIYTQLKKFNDEIKDLEIQYDTNYKEIKTQLKTLMKDIGDINRVIDNNDDSRQKSFQIFLSKNLEKIQKNGLENRLDSYHIFLMNYYDVSGQVLKKEYLYHQKNQLVKKNVTLSNQGILILQKNVKKMVGGKDSFASQFLRDQNNDIPSLYSFADYRINNEKWLDSQLKKLIHQLYNQKQIQDRDETKKHLQNIKYQKALQVDRVRKYLEDSISQEYHQLISMRNILIHQSNHYKGLKKDKNDILKRQDFQFDQENLHQDHILKVVMALSMAQERNKNKLDFEDIHTQTILREYLEKFQEEQQGQMRDKQVSGEEQEIGFNFINTKDLIEKNFADLVKISKNTQDTLKTSFMKNLEKFQNENKYFKNDNQKY